MISRKLAFVWLAAPCLFAMPAHAQSNPVPYWTTAWPAGFGSGFTSNVTTNSFATFNFDGSGVGVGSFSSRYDLPNGWFVGGERGTNALNGFSSAYGGLPSMSYDGSQVGYNFRDTAVPMSLYAGFGTLKYNNAFVPSPLTGFDSQSANAATGYSAHVGVEFRPTSNLSLSVGASFSQQPDPTAALIPGTSAYFNGRR
jgi:hypothetical protein